MTTLELCHRAQRVTLALYGVVTGAIALLSVILPQQVARELTARPLANIAIIYSQRDGAAHLGLALVAIIAAWVPRPPRALVWALFVALAAGIIGPLLSRFSSTVPPADGLPFNKVLFFDGTIALVLLVTQEVRAALRRRSRV